MNARAKKRMSRGSSCSFKRREGTFEAEFMNSFRGKHRSFKNPNIPAAMFDVTLALMMLLMTIQLLHLLPHLLGGS